MPHPTFPAGLETVQPVSICLGTPRHLNAWLNKARSLYNLGRREEVFACHKEMKKIDPAATEALLKAEAARSSLPKQ